MKVFGDYLVEHDGQLRFNFFGCEMENGLERYETINEMYGEEVTFLEPLKENDEAIVGVTTDGNVVYDWFRISQDSKFMENSNEDAKTPIYMKFTDQPSDGAVVLDPRGLDSAIIGQTIDTRVVYDYDLLVKAFMDTEGWNEEDAIDWISYNTIRALPYMPNSPIIVYNVEKYF